MRWSYSKTLVWKAAGDVHSSLPSVCSEVFLQELKQCVIVCWLLHPHHFHTRTLQWLPAFSSSNAMLMQALPSLISLLPLVYPPQFVTNGPTTTPPSLFFFFPSPSPHFPHLFSLPLLPALRRPVSAPSLSVTMPWSGLNGWGGGGGGGI